ncbi:hypothetical protein BCR32DRAFT_328103 [Anaeromyces robustus]|uniref:Uncharacterized protein n=1 Tax=Anaeromyces robustus TaxID=1754192 RepID=A0A1Y1X194_9FUNG|nr:hypothetical protein BCR32DRAFT_328103 [Anaeromyces robustus]|eukprot:ORX79543.1 hypothetical protein BCR32DRAFT_328103 [Anaeromyces robustus]
MEYQTGMEMNNQTNVVPLDRFSPETKTCHGKDYPTFLDGFFTQFGESYFYAFVIQFILVALMYVNVGKGIYWKVLFYASIAGLVASILENGTVASICRESQQSVSKPFSLIFLLIDEVFWIASEYSIPYLNLIKMKAFARGKLALIMKCTIIGLALPFIYFRFMIGYQRMKKGYLNDTEIKFYHGYAFGIMAVADLICTFGILYFVKKNNSHAELTTNLNEYIKHSSYTILLTVDVVSALLSILNIITNIQKNDIKYLSTSTIPFHCLKSTFVLILAVDAFLFKYGAHLTSVQESSGSKSYGGNDSFYSYKNSGSYKPRGPTHSIDMTGKSRQKAPVSNITPFNYPPIEKDMYKSNKMDSPKMSNSKSIIKNYTHIQTNSTLYESPIDKHEVYPQQQFGFLSTQHRNYQ